MISRLLMFRPCSPWKWSRHHVRTHFLKSFIKEMRFFLEGKVKLVGSLVSVSLIYNDCRGWFNLKSDDPSWSLPKTLGFSRICQRQIYLYGSFRNGCGGSTQTNRPLNEEKTCDNVSFVAEAELKATGQTWVWARSRRGKLVHKAPTLYHRNG